MALPPSAQQAVPVKPGPGLSLNLSSKNPFRNPQSGSPSASPSLPPVGSGSPQSAPIRQSTNPFLTAFEQDLNRQLTMANLSDNETRKVAAPSPGTPTLRPTIGDDAKEMFKRLTITDGNNGQDGSRSGPRRPLNPNGLSSRPSTSRRREGDGEIQYRRGPNGLRIPIKPPTTRTQTDVRRGSESSERRPRPRRNSESSVADRPMTEEEKAKRERRRKEREARHKERERERETGATDSKKGDREISGSRSRRRRMVHVDVVDKLDVTGGLYGVSGMWHHDGPFDACRPHRNNKKNALAPMSAFPTGSANNTIGGSGPLNASINLEQFHGLGTEGFNDYSKAGDIKATTQALAQAFNPVMRVEPVHGEETMGLGTSTFLEGAPASRQAIQRTQSDGPGVAGLARKKSLAQRIRGMSQSKGRYNEPFDVNRNPLPSTRFQERSGGVTLSDSPLASPELPRPHTAREKEADPFDATAHDDAYDQKGAAIKTAEVGSPESDASASRQRALSSPRKSPLERSVTADSAPEGSGTDQKSGFLSRVKSLKGPRRMKSERRMA